METVLKISIALIFILGYPLPLAFAQTTHSIPKKTQSVNQGKTARPYNPEIELIWKNGSHLKARLQKLQKDSIYFSLYKNSSLITEAVSVNDLSEIKLIRHGNLDKVMVISVLGGMVGAQIGFSDGDDKPGLFSLTAKEKAILLGGGIGLSILLSAGSVEAIRTSDVEIPLDTLSSSRRKHLVQSILAKKYHTPHPFYTEVAANFLRYQDGRSVAGYLLCMHLQLKPSIWIGLSYGAVSWSDWRQDYYYNNEYETYSTRNQLRLYYLSVTLRKLFFLSSPIHPYFEWGVLHSLRISKTHITDITYGPYASHREDEYSEKEYPIGFPLSIGVAIPIIEPLSIDLRAGNLITQDMPWQFQLGLQLKL